MAKQPKVIENEELMKNWNWKKNNELGFNPNELTCGSGKKVWWLCNEGHEWEASIYHKNGSKHSKNRECPICKKENQTSFPEQAILFYLSQYYKCENRKQIANFEFDIYISELNTAIEYDGIFYHSFKQKQQIDQSKNAFCEKNNITLYRIKETKDKIINCSIENNVIYYIVKSYYSNLDILIKILFQLLQIKNPPVINIEQDLISIYEQYIVAEKEINLKTQNPQLAEEWNYTKNGSLKPTFFSPNSSKKVWWKCTKGHEWQASIDSRNRGNGCPYCSGRKAITGEKDLVTMFPHIAQQWNYHKNGISPNQISAYSNIKYWWICENGHEWQSTVGNRAIGKNCPICAGKKVLQGYNDLTTTHPILCEEWDYEKNHWLPTQCSQGSDKKVWWRCKNCGNNWETTISNRTKGSGCPKCAQKKKGETRRKNQQSNKK